MTLLEGAPTLEETGTTFAENACQKVQGLADWLDAHPALVSGVDGGAPFCLVADDSGLVVDALGGAPGVYSARFAADEVGAQGNANDRANNAKLLRLLEGVDWERRTARFRCVLALLKLGLPPARGGRETPVFEGVCEGRIALAPSGVAGFGYDPLFLPEGHSLSFAELGDEVKNRLSHRFRALMRMRDHAVWA
jgi:XTP/dITP diphosphohydrolase